MKEFSELLQLIGKTMPDLVSLIVCPAVLLVAALLLAIFGKKRAYVPVAVGLGGVAAFLVGCETAASAELFIYVAAYTAFAALLTLLFLIPFHPHTEKKDRTEELYEKFHVPLAVPAETEEPAEEGGGESLRLEHALSLLEQLKGCSLSAGDRLEADAIGSTLESCKGRALGEEEARRINDCLATILKLTAKYKL